VEFFLSREGLELENQVGKTEEQRGAIVHRVYSIPPYHVAYQTGTLFEIETVEPWWGNDFGGLP
jgi:hypothetical protein